MISVIEAQTLIDRQVSALSEETVPLAQVHGRVLREAIVSDEDLPSFDRAAMDGYAVRQDDASHEFQIIGEIRAGHSVDIDLQSGQAIRIFTGARLPGSGLRVLLQEHVETRDQRICVVRKSSDLYVRARGEDARSGDLLLSPGTLIDAAGAALLATLGKVNVRVARTPKVLHLTTGDEIVPPEQSPGPGQIRNSNATLIAALCREQGIGLITQRHAGDNLAEMLAQLSEAKIENQDLVLISGGSGPGAYDFSRELLKHLGATIHFREVNVRPGKPIIFGTTSSQIVFGLPGNALSHFACFHLFVRRALDRLIARSAPTAVQVALSVTMTDTNNARETWWPVQVPAREGRLECCAIPWQSSGDITRLPAAHGLLKVPASTSQLPAGTMVEVLLTRSFFS